MKQKVKLVNKRSATGGTVTNLESSEAELAQVDHKKWFDQHQTRMQEVDSLINKDSDLFAALKLLHPKLHDGIISFTKKL
jgi:uncharacterized protein YbcC (UPF0753/DUF2309 family)